MLHHSAMVEIVLEKMGQLIWEETCQVLIQGVEIERLSSELKQMQWILQSLKQQQLSDWVWGYGDDLQELVYEVDDLVDEIIFDGLDLELQSRCKKKVTGSVKDWFSGIPESLLTNLKLLSRRYRIARGVTTLSERIRLVNYGLQAYEQRNKVKALPFSLPQGQQGVAGDVWKSISHVLEHDLDDMWSENIVVGMKDAREEVITLLLTPTEEFKMISIVGMGGLGKTTLAKFAYQDCTVRSHFDCLSWAYVGEDFRTRNILEDVLLQHITRSREEMMPFSDLDLAQKLYEFLLPKRYLIVLDDVWSTDVWECLRIAFPSGETGSRVLFTSRVNQVAEKITAKKGFLHQMRGLTQEEGWELLQKTAFRGHSPGTDSKVEGELQNVAKDIVKGCLGLPLALKVVGGVLASMPTPHEWKMVHQSMVSYQTMDQGSQDTSKINPILALSFDFLPDGLKHCFLYFSIFPKDAEIEAERLYLLWIAEGFITSASVPGEVSMMDVAERYLNELVVRSMVSVHKQDAPTSRRIKFCRVHDLLRDICLLRAKKWNFCDSINFRRANDTSLGSSSPFSAPRQHRLALSFEDGCVVPKHWNTDKQLQSLSIVSTFLDQQQFKSLPKVSYLRDLSRLRSLYLSGFNYKVLRSPTVTGELFPRQFLSLRDLPQVLSDLSNFKRLRVLVFSGFNFDVTRLPAGIEKLFRLRYLSIRGCNITRFPPTICSLINLEILDLGEGTWIRMLIPEELQKLSRLRHLYLPRCFQVDGVDKLHLDGLIKLETLVNFDSRQCRVKDLRKLTKIRKLVATTDGSFEDLEEIIDCMDKKLNCLRFSSLVVRKYDSYSKENQFVIDKLFRCLNIYVVQIEGHIGKLPLKISESLTKISLSGSELNEDPMEKLEKIPNLWVLVLCNNAFLGKHMTCSGSGMPQLKCLTLSNLQNLENLTLEKGGMPKLSNLVLKSCQSLKELPGGLSFLSSLQELTVAQMPSAFMDRLNETGEDYTKCRHASIIRIGCN